MNDEVQIWLISLGIQLTRSDVVLETLSSLSSFPIMNSYMLLIMFSFH